MWTFPAGRFTPRMGTKRRDGPLAGRMWINSASPADRADRGNADAQQRQRSRFRDRTGRQGVKAGGRQCAAIFEYRNTCPAAIFKMVDKSEYKPALPNVTAVDEPVTPCRPSSITIVVPPICKTEPSSENSPNV